MPEGEPTPVANESWEGDPECAVRGELGAVAPAIGHDPDPEVQPCER